MSVLLQANISIPVATIIDLNKTELIGRLKRDLKLACQSRLEKEFQYCSPVIDDISYTAVKMLDDCHYKNIEFRVTAHAFPF